MDASNGNFKQKLLSNQILPVVVPAKNTRIDDRIALIAGASETLLTPTTNDIVADVAVEIMQFIYWESKPRYIKIICAVRRVLTSRQNGSGFDPNK